MNKTRKQLRKIIDWRAAFIAGFLGGLVSLLANIILSRLIFGSARLIINLSASILLGEKALQGSNYSNFILILIGFIVHFCLSMIFSVILTTIIHRWGLIVGILGGAVFGLGLYAINFYLLSYFFPWFYPLRTWVFLISHMLFGAFVGGIYELLEVDKYISISSEEKHNV